MTSYVLITPARNEAAFIELTIQSVIGQTVLPLKWVIVSDGSTDGTDDMVKKYLDDHDWIELVRMPERKERHFTGKVLAFNAGRDRVEHLNYDVIGNLDADISFEEDYFEFLMGKFAEDPDLGVGGTPFREGSAQYNYRFTSHQHVSGACQLFRRECFESIGGYVPIAMGGIDLVAVITARMRGWKTLSFPEKVCIHHKKTQSRGDLRLRRIFRSGYHDYLMGGDPVWQTFRSGYQMTRAPFVIGGCLLLAGYVWAMLTRAQKPVSDELVAFRRVEQRQRLKVFLKDALTLWRLGAKSGART